MRPIRVTIFAACFFGIALSACSKRQQSAEGNAGMTVLPEGASPGMVVHLTTSRPMLSKETQIDFGGERATISRLISQTEAEVLVPNVSPGQTTLAVSSGKDEKETVTFTVLPARNQQLVLRMKDNRVELVAVQPTSGEITSTTAEATGAEAQLSFDVLNAAGVVVYTAAIPDPIQQRMEVFEGPSADQSTMRREPMSHEAVFAIKVPKLPDGGTVKFFEAAGGVDLLQGEDRKRRTPIGEIKLSGEKQ